MGCEDIIDRLPDWVAGRLDQASADAVAGHVGTCARCAGEVDLLRMLGETRPVVPADLATRITGAVRARAGSVSVLRRRRLAPAWALSAAAVLVLAVGTTVLIDAPAPSELGEVVVEDDAEAWIAEDAVVAGAPVLEELSDDDLAALLEEMGG
jgi:hypothetical protein